MPYTDPYADPNDPTKKKLPANARPPANLPVDPKAGMPGQLASGIIGPIIGNGITGIRGVAATQGAQAGANAAAMGSFAGGGTPGVPGQPTSPGSIASQAGSFTGRGLPGGPIGGNYASQAGTAMGQFGAATAAPGVVNKPAAPMSNNIQRTAGPVPAGTTGRAGAVAAGPQYSGATPTGYVPPPNQQVTNGPAVTTADRSGSMGKTVIAGLPNANSYAPPSVTVNPDTGKNIDPKDYTHGYGDAGPNGPIVTVNGHKGRYRDGKWQEFVEGGPNGGVWGGYGNDPWGAGPGVESRDHRPAPPPGGANTPYTGANPAQVEAIRIANPGNDQRQAALAAQLATVQGRTAPQAAGAVLGPVATAGGANVGAATQATAAQLSPVERAQIVSLGPAAQAGAVHFGPAGQATADKLGPAAQAQAANLAPAQLAADSAFRADQQALVDKLRRQVSGEESVSQLQLNRARDQALADNLSLSRSARPGAAVAAQRTAAQRQSSIEGDFAARAAEAGINERNTAAGALSGLLGTARGQDLSNTQFNTTQGNSFSQLLAQLQQQANLQNASQTNQQAQVGAQLGTSASIANAGNQTQMGIAQGQTAAQVGIANAQQANAQSALAAQLAQSGSQFNAQQGNAANSERARLQQEVALANSAAANQRNLTAAGLDLNARQFDAGATNTQAALAAQLAQNNSQFNTSANLQMTGMNDAATNAALAGQLGNAALAQQGTVSGVQLSLQNQQQVNQVALANMDDATRRYIAEATIRAGKQDDPGWLGRFIQGVLTVGGGIIGGIYGGPAGAAAGAAGGAAVGGAVT